MHLSVSISKIETLGLRKVIAIGGTLAEWSVRWPVNLKVLGGLGVVSLGKTLYSTFPYWFDPVSV